jgi:serine/threonine protein phosphatase PrpC
MENSNLKSIFATVTATNKSENQDSNDKTTSTALNAILVADGLGTYQYARQSSESVVATLLEELTKIEDVACLDFEKLFKTAKEKLIELSEQTKSMNDKSSDNLFGTTLIALVETEKTVKMAYVGNGAIWHIRGNFDEFPAVYPFPWNAVNLLNPHSIPEKGKEALERLISDYPNDDNECIPSVIEVDKDNIQGDIFMICSDGIYSEDQRKRGSNTKGLWVKYEISMQKFFEHLKHFFESQEYSNETLNGALNQYLQEIKPDLDDDATLGVLITEAAINYQKQKRGNENNTDNRIQKQ